MASETIVEMKNISKHFSGVLAVDNVDLEIRSGEVHALVGANGAGKSTLIKMLAGVYRPDHGQIFLEGKDVNIKHPGDAQHLGLSFIHQELELVPNFSALENINLGVDYPKNRLGLIDWTSLDKSTKHVVEGMNLDFPLTRPAYALEPIQRWEIAICRGLVRRSKVVVMDEPTSALTEVEVQRLHTVVRELRQQGVAIIYISHRLDEIFEVADRVTVMRDGKKMGTFDMGEVDLNKVISLIVGKSTAERVSTTMSRPSGNVILSVRGLSCGTIIQNVSFDLRKGEILGIAGLAESGKSEILRAIFGALEEVSGDIYFDGKRILFRSPEEAVSYRIGYLPAERRSEGIITSLSVKENITIADIESFRRWQWGGLINSGKERNRVSQLVKSLSIMCSGIDQDAETLSGGNQQKVVLAKWLCRVSKVLLCDDPTRGVDVGAKLQVYELINQFVKEGEGAVIVASNEVDELTGVAHRILVVHKGILIAEVATREEMDPSQITALCYGRTTGTSHFSK